MGKKYTNPGYNGARTVFILYGNHRDLIPSIFYTYLLDNSWSDKYINHEKNYFEKNMSKINVSFNLND